MKPHQIFLSGYTGSLVSYREKKAFFHFCIVSAKVIKIGRIAKEGYSHQDFTKPFSLN